MKAIRLVATLAACWIAAAPAAAQTQPPVPSSMAILGDSISRGYNACVPYVGGDCIDASWSAGTNAFVNPHYRRIRQLNWAMTAHGFVSAKNGVKVADLNRQAGLAVAQDVDYVTILIGTNDVCTPTPETMTPVATFESRFQQAMSTLTTGLPDATILVVSIPDWHRVWSVAKDTPAAQAAWATGICQSMFANPTSTAQADVDRRAAVRQRIVDFNQALAAVCAQYASCRFDDNAVFDHALTAAELSSADWFHPSVWGQAVLAALTYPAGGNWTTPVRPWSLTPTQVFHHPGTSRKIAQITGDFDKPLQKPTKTQTGAYHVNGTDLGSSFEHKGRLYLLFGDTQGGTAPAQDSFGYSLDLDPANFHLTIPETAPGSFQFQPITFTNAPDVSIGAYCVPTGGVSIADTMYMVYTTDWNGTDMQRSVLASSTNDGMTWTKLFDLSTTDPDRGLADAHFINASLSVVTLSAASGLPAGDYLVLFGSGAYRKSSVYLAAFPIASIAKPSLRYFAGLQSGAPTWTTSEAAAAPLIDEEVVGELSAQWVQPLGTWVLLYNGPGGIVMRTAPAPWGPFSAREVIFDPARDDGYGRFVHVPGMDDFGEGSAFGGVYGPYLLGRYVTGDATKTQLHYVMSTWNPYDVVLMRTEVGAPPAAENPVSEQQPIMPGDGTWSKTAGTWFTSASFTDSTPGIVTGVGEKGVMSRWLPRDAWNRRLSFQVSGGTAEVLLLEGPQAPPPATATVNAALYDDLKAGLYGTVVQASWGFKDETEVPVAWDLRPFDRGNLKLVVIDKATTTWGFVKVSRMTLDRNVESPPPAGGCGNGVQEPASPWNEECDDGNYVEGDGCDSNCTLTRCGNDVATVGEQCDDGNTTGGDCCSASCQLEPLGTVCRAAVGSCDTAETCSGTSPSCPADVRAADGTPCSDANACTIGDACAAGACVGTCNTGAACSEVCGGHCGGAACTCQ